MFGYATDETEECMPLTVVLAHKLNHRIAELRRSGEFWWARPDSKTQVSCIWVKRISNVLNHYYFTLIKKAVLSKFWLQWKLIYLSYFYKRNPFIVSFSSLASTTDYDTKSQALCNFLMYQLVTLPHYCTHYLLGVVFRNMLHCGYIYNSDMFPCGYGAYKFLQ